MMSTQEKNATRERDHHSGKTALSIVQVTSETFPLCDKLHFSLTGERQEAVDCKRIQGLEEKDASSGKNDPTGRLIITTNEDPASSK